MSILFLEIHPFKRLHLKICESWQGHMQVHDHVDVGLVLEVAERLQDRRVVQSGSPPERIKSHRASAFLTIGKQEVQFSHSAYSSHTRNTLLTLVSAAIEKSLDASFELAMPQKSNFVSFLVECVSNERSKSAK